MIGRLRHRVTLEEKTQAPDAAGGFAESWTPVATMWAAIEGRGGRESPQAEQIAGGERFLLRIRWRADVTAALRVIWGARVLAIDSVTDPDGRRRFLLLDCAEDRPS